MAYALRYIFFALLFTPWITHANAPSFFSAPYTDRQLIGVPIAVKTEGVALNTLALEVRYDPAELTFVSAQENTLLGTRWIDAPGVASPGVIHVALTVPGGFTNSFDPLTQSEVPAELATIYFRRASAHTTPIVIDAQTAYYNTPSADAARIAQFEKTVTLDRLPVRVISIDPTSGPRVSSVTIVALEHRLIRTQYAVYVQAVDGAGIAAMQWRHADAWEPLANPFVVAGALFDQERVVRITNGLGVFTETTITIPGIISATYREYVLLLIGASVVAVLYLFLRNKRKKPLY